MRRPTLFSARALHWLLFVALAFGSAGCDLWTKEWAVGRLSRPAEHTSAVCVARPGAERADYQRRPAAAAVLVPGFLELHYAENCGAAWSMFEHAAPSTRLALFTLTALGAIVALTLMYRGTEARGILARLGPPLIVAGAIGNVADRIRRGYVVDFIHAHWRERYDYPVFNVADVLIAVGIAALVLASLRRRRPGTGAGTPAAA